MKSSLVIFQIAELRVEFEWGVGALGSGKMIGSGLRGLWVFLASYC